MSTRSSIMMEDAPQAVNEAGKKPYSKPELTELGSVVELTRGAVQASSTDDGRILHS
jgi:hypothetical protein